MRRFWNKVEITDDCWLWTAATTSNGYGSFGLNGCVVYAHRFAYELCIGQIPEDQQVLHSCDNPPCCNPAHLFLGSHADNMADMATKHRNRFGVSHHNAKLSDIKVAQIRAGYAAGETQRTLAKKYCVNQSCISRSICRLTWRRVTHEVSEA